MSDHTDTLPAYELVVEPPIGPIGGSSEEPQCTDDADPEAGGDA